DADETREAHLGAFGGRRWHLCQQLLAEWALALLDTTALCPDLVSQLHAGLVPQPAGARCCERLRLQRRSGVIEADGDDALGLLLDPEARVQALTGQHLNATEVDVRAGGVGLRVVERSCSGTILRRRLQRGFDLFSHSLVPWVYPVDPKPPSPRTLLGSSATGSKRAWTTGITISC